ncbi:hypothetical protein ACFWGI_06870, partial [Streptomyces niveus]|uniref:hypothetical protein n=1 Tax=Streptomyces niveus TaxID=193462 RepID=UPI0036593176
TRRTVGCHGDGPGRLMNQTASDRKPDASALVETLQQLLHRAGVSASVWGPSADEPGLRFTVRGRVPFELTAEAAQQWLDLEEINARAYLDELGYLVVAFPVGAEDAAHAFTEILTTKALQAQDIVDALQETLDKHGLGADAAVSVQLPNPILIEITDRLDTAVALGVLLGADHIAEKLKPGRRKGMRKLANRLRLVLSGALGHGITTSAEPGCEHKADRLAIGLSLAQATTLTGRIAATTALGASVEECYSRCDE